MGKSTIAMFRRSRLGAALICVTYATTPAHVHTKQQKYDTRTIEDMWLTEQSGICKKSVKTCQKSVGELLAMQGFGSFHESYLGHAGVPAVGETDTRRSPVRHHGRRLLQTETIQESEAHKTHEACKSKLDECNNQVKELLDLQGQGSFHEEHVAAKGLDNTSRVQKKLLVHTTICNIPKLL